MANRTLHVANAYAKYQNLSPAKLIQRVHDDMYKKFVATAQGRNMAGAGSNAEAKELQDFFQGLKYYAKYQNGDQLAASVDQAVIQQVLSNVNAKLTNNRLIQNLFRRTSSKGWKQGEIFEDELAQVVEEVLSMGSGKQIQPGATKVGKQLINIGKNGKIDIDGYGKELIEAVGKGVYNKMQNIKTTFSAVQGKIDISGLQAQVHITANPKSYLFRIATLLSKANISAKSYASNYWSNAIKMRIMKVQQELHLGHTDPRRIYTDLFTKEAGTPAPVSLSLFMYLKHTKNQQLQSAANRLRFIYELTGYGQQYIDSAIRDVLNTEGLGHANYFIYNDPASDNIYVQSTAGIIAEMWDVIDDIIKKDSVTLSKSFFMSSASAFNSL